MADLDEPGELSDVEMREQFRVPAVFFASRLRIASCLPGGLQPLRVTLPMLFTGTCYLEFSTRFSSAQNRHADDVPNGSTSRIGESHFGH